MKKRLLFAIAAMCVAVSGFALTNGEFVYTPQGRFQITSDLKAYSNFTDFSGWEVITAVDGATVMDNFIIDTENAPVAGTSCAKSNNATASEGMYFKFTPTDANATYVVSYKMKGAQGITTRVSTAGSTVNVVKVEGNTDGVYGGTTNVLTANIAEELTEEWQTFNYAIVGDGTPGRTYFISLAGTETNIYIADLQIAEALQVADLRARDAALEKINVYKDAYAWDADVLAEYGINDALDALNAIGDQSAQTELDKALTTADETLTEFLNSNMDDYLAGNAQNYLPKGAKISDGSAGQWTSTTRVYRSADYYYDFGHYVAGGTWMNGEPTKPMGIYMVKNLTKGSYVFSVDAAAAVREGTSSQGTGNWTNNDGLNVGYAVLYIKKATEGDHVNVTKDDAESCVAFKTYDVSPVPGDRFTPGIVSVQVTEDGDYEFGIMVYCKEQYQTRKNGSVTYFYNAQMYGKNESAYNQKQLTYEADVREQIAKGREELTNAANNIANAEKPWGKAELQACVDTIAPKIEGYEALTQDDIIDTYQEYYDHENRTKDDNGIMVYEVYTEAVKDIIAANRTFTAVNDTLASMQTAIDNAEGTMAMRVYSTATGKDALKAAIAKAKETQAAMKAAEYSVENAAAIVTANAELADAVDLFKTTIPTAAVEEIISVDFEKGAKQNAESLLYEVEGNNTTMVIENFSETTPIADDKDRGTMNFELGIDSNGEKVLPGVLRIGDGSAYAAIPVKDYGTNIVKVSMDFWFIRLTNGLVGFELTDANEERVAGLKFVPYNNNLTGSGSQAGFDSFKIGDSNYGKFFKSNTAGNAASCADNNLSHIECILDYGEKSMYLVSTNASGTFTSEKVSFNGLVPVKITISSNYKNYIGRRCWFDNLKIEQIQAGATEPFVGIENAKAAEAKEAPVKVFKNGQIIINGKYNAAGAVVK